MPPPPPSDDTSAKDDKCGLEDATMETGVFDNSDNKTTEVEQSPDSQDEERMMTAGSNSIVVTADVHHVPASKGKVVGGGCRQG